MGAETVSRFFLGSNSAAGFFSLYDGFAKYEDGNFLWVIKGGPGCGKSSFMKYLGKAAEGAGLEVEYILCSGDPDSLDGVYFPALKTGYADGTAPHVMDPRCPAAGGLYLDLGAFYDSEALAPHLEELHETNARYKALYTRAYSSLSAAGAMDSRDYPGLVHKAEYEAAETRAAKTAARVLGRERKTKGKVSRRFLSSVTCKGRVFLEDTLTALCPVVYTLDNEFGLADKYIKVMADEARRRGLDAILCPEPLDTQRHEALLIPELGTGFLAVDARRGFSDYAYRHVRLDAITDIERVRQLRPKLRNMNRLRESLIDDAVATLAEAKAIHDGLEKLYNPHVDFEGLYSVAEEHSRWLQLRAEEITVQAKESL